MYNQVSDAFASKIQENARTFRAKIIRDDAVIDAGIHSINITYGSQSGDDISIGGAVSSCVYMEIFRPSIALENYEMQIQIGLALDAEWTNYEWVPVGVFTVSSAKDDNGTVAVTAYDRMMKFEAAYFSSLADTTNTVAVLNEMSTQIGVPIITSKLTGIAIAKPTGEYTAREMLSYIAQLHGGFACCNRNGEVEIRWYEDSGIEITAGKHDSFLKNECDYAIDYVECATGTKTVTDSEGNESEETIVLTSGGGARGLSFSNPFMTQAVLDKIYAKLKGFAYRPAEINLLQSDIRLDTWDTITVYGIEGTAYKVPCMELILAFDGGVGGTIKAVGKSEIEEEISYKGPLTQAVERIASEMSIVNKLIANSATITYLEANYATISQLDTVNAQIDKLVSSVITVDYLKANYAALNEFAALKGAVDNLTANNITVAYLDANYAAITQLDAINAQIDSLSAAIITAEYLKANYAALNEFTALKGTVDSLTANSITVAYLEANYATITQLLAVNAQIDSLTAAMITADYLTANYATIAQLTAANTQIDNLIATSATVTYLAANYATLQQLAAANAQIDNLNANMATVAHLEANYATLNYLSSNYATIVNLQAATANIQSLSADVASINTLLNGNLTSQNIQSLHITATNTVFDNAVINNAAIASVSADKLTAGTIYTNLINVQSQNGQLYIADNTIQIKDSNRARVQIGEDAAGDYSMYVWDASGNLMFDALGLHESGIKSGIIKDSMVSDSANISAYKLDVSTLNSVVNNGSVTINSSNVLLDTTGQRLNVAFTAITTLAESTAETLENLEIGGRNLLLNSDFSNGKTSWSGSNGSVLTILSGTDIPGTPPPGVSYCLKNAGEYSTQTVELEKAVEYTLSGWVYIPSAVTATIKLSVWYSNSGWQALKGSSTITERDTWVRKSLTFTTNATYSTTIVGFGGSMNNSPTSYIALAKLEKGNTATDWSPAPEDVDSEISTITSSIQTLTTDLSVVQGQISAKIWSTDITTAITPINTSITSLSDQYTSLNATIGGITATVANHTSQIANKADGTTVTSLQTQVSDLSLSYEGFKTTVSNTYVTQTEFDNLSVGGRNLFRQSGRWTVLPDTTYWGSNGGGISLDSTVLYMGYPTLKTSLGAGIYGYSWVWIELDTNKTYTYSALIRSDLTTSWSSVTPLHAHISVDKTTFVNWATGCDIIKYEQELVANEWTKLYVTFKPKSAEYKYWRPFVYYGSAVVCTVNIAYLKLEEGNVATDWTPAPEDTDSAIAAVSLASTTYYEQLSDKFSWLVASGTSQSNFTLTSRTAQLVAEQINLSGLVTFSGLNSSVQTLLNETVIDVSVMYALGTSTTTAPTTGWSTTAPTWVSGQYMWQKTVTTYADGTVETSAITCISGATGATGATGSTGSTGATGVGVSAIKEQYYLSTSSTTQTGGSWSDTMPTWTSGNYIWTRSYITWTNGTTSTTTAVLANAINSANTTAATASSTASTAASNASTALSTANTAATNASSALSTANSVNSTIAAWCYNNNTTYINGGKIYTGTITATQIASGTITATQIASGTITATQIASSAITTDKIAANAITAAKIAAGTITATQIASSAITADKLNVKGLTVTNSSNKQTFAISSAGEVSINSSNVNISGGTINITATDDISGVEATGNTSVISISATDSYYTWMNGVAFSVYNAAAGHTVLNAAGLHAYNGSRRNVYIGTSQKSGGFCRFYSYSETEVAYLGDTEGGDGGSLTLYNSSGVVQSSIYNGEFKAYVSGSVKSTYAANATIGGTLSVTGVATLSNAVTVGGTLTVTGATKLSSTATIGSTLSVTGATSLSNTLTVGSTLTVTGATKLSSTLAVTGVTTLSSNATVGGTLSVTGATTLSSTVTINNALTVSGATKLSSTLTVGSTLSVTGTATLSSTVYGNDIRSNSTLYAATSIYVGRQQGGAYSDAERSICFYNTGTGTYNHQCRFYGGSSTSTTGIGAYDSNNGHQIWIYNDNSETMSIPSDTALSVAGTVTMPKKLQAGYFSAGVAATGTTYSKTITFSTAFASAPTVTVNPHTSVPQSVFVAASSISSTGMTVYWRRTDSATDFAIGWIASARTQTN